MFNNFKFSPRNVGDLHSPSLFTFWSHVNRVVISDNFTFLSRIVCELNQFAVSILYIFTDTVYDCDEGDSTYGATTEPFHFQDLPWEVRCKICNMYVAILSLLRRKKNDSKILLKTSSDIQGTSLIGYPPS